MDVAWQQLCAARVQASDSDQGALQKVLSAESLLRPIKQLMASPHLLSGWLSLNQDAFRFEDGHFSWAENPIEVLADTYHFLRLDWNDALPAANMIWDHDHAILSDAEDFYTELGKRFDTDDWAAISELLAGSRLMASKRQSGQRSSGTPWLSGGRGDSGTVAGNGAIHGLL